MDGVVRGRDEVLFTALYIQLVAWHEGGGLEKKKIKGVVGLWLVVWSIV